MPKNSFYQCTISYSLFIYRIRIDDVEVVINTTSESVNRAAGCSYCLFVFEISFIRLDTQFHFYWFSVLCNSKTKRVINMKDYLFHLCHSAGSAFQCETQFPKKKRRIHCLYENKDTSLYNIIKGIEVLYLYTYENIWIKR